MSQRQSIIRVLCLLVLMPLITTSCVRDRRLPTAVSPQASHLKTVVPNLPALAVGAPALSSSDGSTGTRVKTRRKSRRELMVEAKGSLMMLLACEQVYFQKYLAFASVADTGDIRVKFGVDLRESGLSEASRRWAYSVTDLSYTGLVATAQGRPDTEAEMLVVTLSYERWQPLVWKVEKTRRGRQVKRLSDREP